MLVVIESPYGKRPSGEACTPGQIEENVAYLRRCMADSFARGEAPYASHGLYPGTLDDSKPEERRKGMEAGFAWGEKAALRAVYVDFGVTPGMLEGVQKGRLNGQRITFRTLTAPGADFETTDRAYAASFVGSTIEPFVVAP
jgi:hypothetical protein